jgi:hypothetical protein
MNPYRILSSRPARGDDAWVARTLLFQHLQRIKSDVDVHKWYESEKAGCDIGWDRASVSYVVRQALHRGE